MRKSFAPRLSTIPILLALLEMDEFEEDPGACALLVTAMFAT